ncbi:hypothetical protein OC834_007545, partial [Tilletia horrida]
MRTGHGCSAAAPDPPQTLPATYAMKAFRRADEALGSAVGDYIRVMAQVGLPVDWEAIIGKFSAQQPRRPEAAADEAQDIPSGHGHEADSSLSSVSSISCLRGLNSPAQQFDGVIVPSTARARGLHPGSFGLLMPSLPAASEPELGSLQAQREALPSSAAASPSRGSPGIATPATASVPVRTPKTSPAEAAIDTATSRRRGFKVDARKGASGPRICTACSTQESPTWHFTMYGEPYPTL